MDRRKFIQTSSIAAAGMLMLPSFLEAKKKTAIGLQLYTLRDVIMKDVKGTLDFLVQAYKSNPQRIDLLLTIAQLQYIEQKDLNGAVQTLEYLVGNNPTYADGRLALASLYAKTGKYEDASNLLVGIKTDDEKTRLTLDSYIAQLKNNQDPFIDKSGVPIKTATSTAKVSATSTAKKK